MLLWEVASLGDKPFKDWRLIHYKLDLLAGKRLGRPELCTPELYSLLQRCWSLQPEQRPTFEDIYAEVSQVHLNADQAIGRVPVDSVTAVSGLQSAAEGDLGLEVDTETTIESSSGYEPGSDAEYRSLTLVPKDMPGAAQRAIRADAGRRQRGRPQSLQLRPSDTVQIAVDDSSGATRLVDYALAWSGEANSSVVDDKDHTAGDGYENVITAPEA